MRTYESSGSTQLDRLVPELTAYLKRTLSRRRFLHSLRVAETSKELAGRYGLPCGEASFAGLCHDLAREWRNSDLIAAASRDGIEIGALERDRPILLHGRAAAFWLVREHGLRDAEVLDAIRFHTLGRPGIGQIGKVLFVADYIEPKRRYMSRSFRRDVAQMALDEALVAIVDHALSRGKSIADSTRAMYDEIRTGLLRRETSETG